MADKIPVAVLGATGAVGQRFIQLLADHPWFEVVAVAASERSAGRPYAEAANWVIPGDPPLWVGEMIVQPLEPDLSAKIVFSALPSSVARAIEPFFARAGYAVCSNASAYREEPGVPLLIPEINADHVAMIPGQRRKVYWRADAELSMVEELAMSTTMKSNVADATDRATEPIRATMNR